jgi:solute carrier family 12 sodium/potassium/chloride transporter 2
MANSLLNHKANFGTLPVFMTTVSTILGAILFLRFGYAVGHHGFLGALLIILIGHIVTFPTAMAVAEIATNQKVQGGGAYFIISRSFGLNIGASIGIALFFSQAISVSFYIIAFAEASDPVINWLHHTHNIPVFDKRWISIPSMAILSILILTRGANVGMKALYVVVAILFTSIIFFLLGKPVEGVPEFNLTAKIAQPDNFFFVFTIIFPAFTGLAAGLGLSGDLKNPSKSIPTGTLWATIVGFFVYIVVAYKLAISASPEELASDQLIMQRIAIWGPIIPIGLAAASLSSALGSIMVAPRTLQAIGYDDIFPSGFINRWFSKGTEGSNEPVNAAVITIIIAFFFIAIGDINFVAQIISMFFMVTYGAICLISFLEHFAADPSYRPTFKSKWYLSLIGGVFSIWLMFKMNAPYAIFSVVIMSLFYVMVTSFRKDKKGLEKLFRGVVFQLSRQIQIFAQRADKEDLDKNWRPFAICVTQDTFIRRSAFDMLRWISYKYGFGTYIHFIKGILSEKSNRESKEILKRLINLSAGSKNRVYLDTIISPSYTSAIAQVIQLSGISGKGNNMILFEFSSSHPDGINEALKTHNLLQSTGFDICVLHTSYKGFGYKQQIHIWITSSDYDNANLMILLGYIILGHPEWKKGILKIYALYNSQDLERKRKDLLELIRSGRIPISPSNINLISMDETESKEQIITEKSTDADLVMVGFRFERIRTEGVNIFKGYENLSNTLFISSNQEKELFPTE